MKRNLSLFLATFVLGALLALVTRAALLNPHADQSPQTTAAGDYAPMVSNAATAAAPDGSRTAPAPASAAATTDAHAHHAAAAAAPAAADQPVNTVCAICGMPVDPKVPFAQYQGKTIGFGCKMCRPKFEADPDRYGPAYLRNEVL